MGKGPDLDHDQLRSVPLFAGFTDEQLDTVMKLCEPVTESGVLFEANQAAEAFYILTDGAVTLEAEDEQYELRPLAVIGELGALTGRTRNSTARVRGATDLCRIPINPLLELFEARADIGLGFQQNLMHIVAEKIARDQTRMQDMRKNIVRTQKAMKQMRELLLESEDTVVSQPLHDTMDELIQRNRRVNYRVSPPSALAATVRFDDGLAGQVVEVSRTHISFRTPRTPGPQSGERISAVLSLSGPEIPVSGKVLRVIRGRVDVELDPMVDEYVAVLEGYLTRVQMLDFLV